MRFLVAVAVADAALAAVDATGEVLDPATVPFAAQANAMEGLWEAARSFMQSGETVRKPSPARVKALASSLIELGAQARYTALGSDAFTAQIDRDTFQQRVAQRLATVDPTKDVRLRVQQDMRDSDAKFMHAAHLDDPTFYKAFGKDAASLVAAAQHQESLLQTGGAPAKKAHAKHLKTETAGTDKAEAAKAEDTGRAFSSVSEKEWEQAFADGTEGAIADAVTKNIISKNRKAEDKLNSEDFSLPSAHELGLDRLEPPLTQDQKDQVAAEKQFEIDAVKEEEREEQAKHDREIERKADLKNLEDLVENAPSRAKQAQQAPASHKKHRK